MKIKVWTKNDPAKKLALLKLIEDDEDDSGGVDVCAVDEDGDHISSLFRINSDGTVSFHTCVREDLGFKLDDDGRIKRGEDI